MSNSIPTFTDPIAPDTAEAAYLRLLPEILAVPEETLTVVNIDVMTAVTTCLGSLPEIRALRSQLEAKFTDFDFGPFDKLEDYALALSHAHSAYRASSTSRVPVADMARELTLVRDRILGTASSLVNYGLIDGERIKGCKMESGYRALATDVLVLVKVLKEAWPNVGNKVPLTLPDVNQAVTEAVALLEAVGLKEQAPVILGEATTLRLKAFTLFIEAYGEARRAIVYLREPFGDADDIAPSLYAGRVRRALVEEPESEPAVTPAPPVQPTPAPPPALPTVAGFHIDNRAGLPITSPFAR